VQLPCSGAQEYSGVARILKHKKHCWHTPSLLMPRQVLHLGNVFKKQAKCPVAPNSWIASSSFLKRHHALPFEQAAAQGIDNQPSDLAMPFVGTLASKTPQRDNYCNAEAHFLTVDQDHKRHSNGIETRPGSPYSDQSLSLHHDSKIFLSERKDE
jgi:hypothetical protein